MFYMSEIEAQTAAVADLNGTTDDFHPSTDWAQGGPILESEEIEICRVQIPVPAWSANTYALQALGPTLLVAGMRAYVASKFGKTVSVPADLVI